MPKFADNRTPILPRLRRSASEMKRPQVVIGSALLIALNLVLDRFTVIINPTLHVSFSFLTKAITGVLYGPVVGMYAGALNDVIAYMVYPKGAFFIGFTVSSALTGFLYGLFLYNVRLRWWRVIAAQTTVTVLINLCLNTLWLSILYDKAAWGFLAARFAKNIIMLPIETVMVMVLVGALNKALSAAKLRE